MELTFDTRGNEKQKKAVKDWLNPKIEEITYGGAKGGGKSFLGCSLIFGDALIYPETHYFISRKKLNDLRKFTIPSIHEVLNNWKIDSSMYKYNGQDNYFQLYNQSKIYLIDAKHSPSDPLYQRFGSMQMTRGWIEEGGEFEISAKNNLKISIGRWKNEVYNLPKKLLITANPAKNFLYKDFYMPNKNGTIEEWRSFIQALPYDNKMLSKGYIENLERTLKGNERKRLLGGDWEYDDDPDALCEFEKIVELFKNNHIQPGVKYITADIARFGSDKAVIGVWSGWILEEIYTMDKSSTVEIQHLINTLRIKNQIPTSRCVADEDGVGGGVVDNCGIKGFVNNSRPLQEDGLPVNYANLQNQCLYKLAKYINNNSIFISADVSERVKEAIIEELEQIKSDNKDLSRLKTKNKDFIKEQIGRSPDYRDMILMRMFFELTPKPISVSYSY